MPTHGSLTKAGKVRSQTPKVVPREKSSLAPRQKVVRKFWQRQVLQRKAGQNWVQ